MIPEQEVSFLNTAETFEKQDEQEFEDYGMIFICENTDGILDPLEQMLYALNETQVRYGPVTGTKERTLKAVFQICIIRNLITSN